MHTTQLCALIVDYCNALMLLLMMTQGRPCRILCYIQLQSVEFEGSCVSSPQVLPWQLLYEGSHCLSWTAWTAASRGSCRSYNTGYTVMLSGRIALKRLVPHLRLQNYAGRVIIKEPRVTSASWVWERLGSITLTSRQQLHVAIQTLKAWMARIQVTWHHSWLCPSV